MKSPLYPSAVASTAVVTTFTSLPSSSLAFLQPPRPSAASAPSVASPVNMLRTGMDDPIFDLTFTPPDTLNEGQISEQLCADAASKMKRVMVPVSKEVSDTGFVGISYIKWDGIGNNKSGRKDEKMLPLLLVHGFDSSALEYRRLGPQLAALGVDVYCVDLLGWGFTQLDSVNSFSARAKVEALKGFWSVVGKNEEVVVGGASLGGAAVIEFAVENLWGKGVNGVEGANGVSDDGVNGRNGSNGSIENEGFVRGAILIDAQGFVDGIGPMSFLPTPLARLGIRVLQSIPLRNSANQMSYFDPSRYATEDALKVGRLHCLREGWEEGMLSFMKSGGFAPRETVGLMDVPTLVLWGREDGILEGGEFAQKFIDVLPNAQLQWIDECGHVPHLEKPEITAHYISEFLRSDGVRPLRSSPQEIVFDVTWGFVGGVGSLAAATAAASVLMGGGL